MTRGWTGRIALLLASTVLSLVVAELWLRTRADTELGFRYENGRFTGPREFEPDRRTNRLGFHDAEPGAKLPGTRRILLLGDSYVAAISVALEETVGQRLQHHLNTGGGAFQVVSLGEQAAGQGEELALLERYGPRLEPDLVVTLFLAFNDVRDNDPALELQADSELAAMQRFRPGWSRIPRSQAPLFWIEGSRLNQLLSFQLARRRGERSDRSIPTDYFVYATTPDPLWEDAWQRTFGQLAATRRLAEALGAEYALVSASTPHGVHGPKAGRERIVAAYPAAAELELDLDLPDRRLAAWAAAAGVPFLALEPILRRELAQDGEPLHWAYDGHWNVHGNDRAGDLMARFVRTLPLR